MDHQTKSIVNDIVLEGERAGEEDWQEYTYWCESAYPNLSDLDKSGIDIGKAFRRAS